MASGEGNFNQQYSTVPNTEQPEIVTIQQNFCHTLLVDESGHCRCENSNRKRTDRRANEPKLDVEYRLPRRGEMVAVWEPVPDTDMKFKTENFLTHRPE